MLKELIEKLKRKKHQIQSYKSDNDDINTGIKVHEEKEVEIIVSSQNNITKIEITDYIDLLQYGWMESEGQKFPVTNGLGFLVDDYALNQSYSYVTLPGTNSNNIKFKELNNISIYK